MHLRIKKINLKMPLRFLRSKKIVFIFCFIFSVCVLNFFKHQFIFYLPFDIPGTQMAATIPPLGTFMESHLKTENLEYKCSVFKHENVHWMQYKRMGLIKFYACYLYGFILSGRKFNAMEIEARKPCRGK
jgi:hypothetical protein